MRRIRCIAHDSRMNEGKEMRAASCCMVARFVPAHKEPTVLDDRFCDWLLRIRSLLRDRFIEK